MVGGTDAGTQTVEAGSQVFPYKYGNTDAHVFIYYTANNYGNNGCYNLDCSAFIQTSSVVPIGASIPVSTFNGFQFEGTIAWYRDPGTGNWILFRKFDDGSYQEAGYYPAYLFGQGAMSSDASRVDFGGENLFIDHELYSASAHGEADITRITDITNLTMCCTAISLIKETWPIWIRMVAFTPIPLHPSMSSLQALAVRTA